MPLSPKLVKLLLLAAAASGTNTTPLQPLARQDFRSCLSSAVNGDAARAQFQDEADFIAKDVIHFNLNLQYKPFAVMYPQNTQEITEILKCATTYERKVQPRSGGRDIINKCLGGADDAIVVDLRNFRQMEVDNVSGIATIGPGHTLKSLVEGLHNASGRFIPHGSSPAVGLGGHAMVGGIGLTSRENAMAIDAIQEIEVVLANGTVTRATSERNPDLFWAMRGAGASFGIATEFKFQTKPEPQEIVSFTYNYSSNDTAVIAGAIKAYQNIIRDTGMSRKFGASGVVTKNSFILNGAFFGSKADYEALNLNSRLPAATSTSVTPGMTWVDFMNQIFGVSGAQAHFYARDTAVNHDTIPSDATIEKWVNFISTTDAGSPNWRFRIEWYGGAVNDIAVDATPFPHRNIAYFVTASVNTDGETSEKAMEFIDNAILTLQNNEPGKYLNYAGVPNLRLDGQPQEKYWGSNLPRLEEIKAMVDPNDLFSTPQNVKPGL